MSLDLSNAQQIRPNIYVDTNDVDFLEHVKSDLTVLESREVGKRLITRISRGKHAVHISRGKDNYCVTLDRLASCTRGKGSSSKISYSLKPHHRVDFRGKEYTVPPFFVLAHELIHAYHGSNGKDAITQGLAECSSAWWKNREEIHTIRGFPSKNPSRNKPKISENAILAEHGYPERFGHISADALKTQSPSLLFNTLIQRVTDIFFRVLINPHSSAPVYEQCTNFLRKTMTSCSIFKIKS